MVERDSLLDAAAGWRLGQASLSADRRPASRSEETEIILQKWNRKRHGVDKWTGVGGRIRAVAKL